MTASPYDNPLSALREHVDDLAVWLAIWEARREPDAHARRCASDPVVIDRHAHDVAAGERYGNRNRGLSNVNRYATLALAYRLSARELGEIPSSRRPSCGSARLTRTGGEQ